jgi:hypothetical protein
MGRRDDVLTLVGRIYDAAFEPELWPQLVAELRDAVGGAQAVLGIHGFMPHSVRLMAPRLDLAFLRGSAITGARAISGGSR